MTDISNQKYKELNNPWMTFLTPTFNRRSTLPRCYESLKKMNPVKDADGNEIRFEWIIVDDGSSDDTRSLVESWLDENIIPIRYTYQQNKGKHVACINGLSITRSTMVTILDSDDSYLSNSLQVFWDSWNSIPIDMRHRFCSVTFRTLDPETGRINGNPLPRQPYYVKTTDMRLKDKIKGEMGGFNVVSILKKYMTFTDHNLNFLPESIIWYSMSNDYLESVVDIPLRLYYHDTENSLTGKNTKRSAANYYLWQYIVNNLFLKYVRYSPKEMFKGIVGMSMDGFATNRSIKKIIADANHPLCKVLVALFMPVGYILSKR